MLAKTSRLNSRLWALSIFIILAAAALMTGGTFAATSASLPLANSFDQLTDTINWATRASMPTARGGLGVAAAPNGKIYAIGGYTTPYWDSSGKLATVEEYNPATNTWTPRASMPTARGWPGVATATNGRIYVVGGWDGSALSNVEVYDPATNTWATKANMSTPRWNLALAVGTNGKLYAIGGQLTGSSFTSLVEEYDPATDAWTSKASMPTARGYLGVATSSIGHIYAIGGWNNVPPFLNTVEEYDPAANAWTTRAPMPTGRSHLAIAISNNRIYAIGGLVWDSPNYVATVEEYTPETNTWATETDMPTMRAYLGATAIDSKLYVVGGNNTNGSLTTVEEGSIGSSSDPCAPAWSEVPSPDLGSYSVFKGVAAVSANDVWAVGYDLNSQSSTLVEHWDGATWSIVPGPSPGSQSSLYGVAAVSANDVWAVGDYYNTNIGGWQPMIGHWNGISWSVVPSPNLGTSGGSLLGVAAVSANDVWAVGWYGVASTLVEHWDGTSWSVVSGPGFGTNANPQLHGVAAVSGHDVWAVGRYYSGAAYQTLIQHWNGIAWSLIPSPNSGSNSMLQGVTAVSANDVWAVGLHYEQWGNNIRTLIEHWDGTAWSVVPNPNPSSNNDMFYGVAAVSANDVWAVGTADVGSYVLVEHWDGVAWSVVPASGPSPDPNPDAYLFGVAAISVGDVWAVGTYYFNGNYNYRQTLVEHYMSSCATPTATPTNTPTPTPTPSPIPSSCPGVPPNNPPSLVVIVLPGIHTHLDQPIEYYPVPMASPGSHYAVSSYCYPPGGNFDTNFPQAVKDMLKGYNDPPPFTGQSLTNQLAARSAVLLPFSYEGAYFLAPSTAANPLFHVSSWTEENSSNTSIDVEARIVYDEVKTVNRVWPHANIMLVGHSNGGLSAEQYWEKYGQHEDYRVRAIFTLDSPINGVRRIVPICWQGLCWTVGSTTAADYLRLWHTIAFRDPDLAAQAGRTLRMVGTSTDFVYNVPDLPTSPLQSQILHSCTGWPLLPCQAYGNPPNFTSPCRFRSVNWLDSHGFVLRCPEVIDYIMSGIPTQDGPHPAVPTGPMATFDTPSGQMSPPQVSLGQAATINGQGFGTTVGEVQFTAGDDLAEAGITSWTDTQIGITVPMTATTGPVIVMVPSYGQIVVALSTVLDPDNGVAGISVATGTLALWGQPMTITVTTRDGTGQPLPNKQVAVSDGITDTVQQTGLDGIALFPLRGYDTQEFTVHSGTVYTPTTLTWSQPPTMTLIMSVSDIAPPDGEPITVSATLRDEAGQPVPNQPLEFRTIGSADLQLTEAEAWTDSSGNAMTVVTNTGSEHFLVSAVANASTTSAFISIRSIAAPSLVGHVTWQGRPSQPNSLQELPITLTLKLGSSGSETSYPVINTTASGFFTASVSGLLTGTYTWRAKGPTYLAVTGTVTLTDDLSTQLEMGTQRAGDCDGDNAVGLGDFNILKDTFGTSVGNTAYDPRADFNGDTTISLADFNLLKGNFGAGGAPPIRPEGP